MFIFNVCLLYTSNLAKNTVTSYVWTVQYFLNHYGEVNKKNLLAYKGYLVENFKPQTVNLRLQGINKFLEFIKQDVYKRQVYSESKLENAIINKMQQFLLELGKGFLFEARPVSYTHLWTVM